MYQPKKDDLSFPWPGVPRFLDLLRNSVSQASRPWFSQSAAVVDLERTQGADPISGFLKEGGTAQLTQLSVRCPCLCVSLLGHPWE